MRVARENRKAKVEGSGGGGVSGIFSAREGRYRWRGGAGGVSDAFQREIEGEG